MTWADLIADVRAQIGVTPDQAYAWLLDKARVMNAESDWLLAEETVTAPGGTIRQALPADAVKVEAVLVNGCPCSLRTRSQLDREQRSQRRIYGPTSDGGIAILPAPLVGDAITIRYLQDVPDNRAGSPPFPSDFHSALADGAIATGLARSDERFDSAGYFDARFSDAVQRLKLRRHSRVGRGGVPIRTVR
jgi:hypothetical protein